MMYRDFINHFSVMHSILVIACLLMSISYTGAWLSTYVTKKPDDMDKHRLWADSMIGTLSWGLIFLLAFSISNTWTYVASTNEVIALEASQIKNILIITHDSDNKSIKNINALAIEYINEINQTGTQSMREGHESPITRLTFTRILNELNNLKKNAPNNVNIASIDSSLKELVILREKRLGRLESYIPIPLMDSILALSCFFSFVLGFSRCERNLKSIWPLLFFCFGLSVLVALTIQFNYPFSGTIGADLGPYERALTSYQMDFKLI